MHIQMVLTVIQIYSIYRGKLENSVDALIVIILRVDLMLFATLWEEEKTQERK